MSNIADFVHDALEAGKTRPEIGTALLHAGWREDEVNTALEEFDDADFPVPVPRRKPHVSARDTFLHLVAFLTLYISAFAAGTLLFQFVNLLFPDPLMQEEWHTHEVYGLLRFSAASVIIAFPIYLYMTRRLQQGYRTDPDQRASGVRKWLTYITLFVAASMVISYLIALVYQLLGGELGIHFALKVLIVIGIAGSVFGYYMPGLRQEERQASHGIGAPA